MSWRVGKQTTEVASSALCRAYWCPEELASKVHEAGSQAYRVKKTGLDRCKPFCKPPVLYHPFTGATSAAGLFTIMAHHHGSDPVQGAQSSHASSVCPLTALRSPMESEARAVVAAMLTTPKGRCPQASAADKCPSALAVWSFCWRQGLQRRCGRWGRWRPAERLRAS